MNSSVKTVLITGASSGIGMALAIFYAKQHYRVFACARSRNKLGVLAEQYPNIKPLVFDITDKKAVTQQCQTLSELDLVILNAGDCEYMDDVQQFDAQLFERIVQTNLISCGYLLQQLAYKIVQKGQLVFVGSSVTLLPLPRAQAYGASKAGLAYLARSMAVDLYPRAIDVSLVSPGFVATPLTAKNDFSMPFMISAEQAARRIAGGIKRRSSHIAFPRRIIWPMRLISLLPDRWWLVLAAKFIVTDPDNHGEKKT